MPQGGSTQVPRALLAGLLLCAACPALAVEHLDRGLIARARNGGQVFLSWRLFHSDDAATTFNVYRGTQSGAHTFVANVQTSTNYLDATTQVGTTYHYVVKPEVSGTEGPASREAAVTSAATGSNTRTIDIGAAEEPDRCVLADLDGDAVLDYLVLSPRSVVDPYYWYFSTSTFKLRAINGATNLVMWSHDLGWGIELGTWYSPYTAFDLSGDGKAEVFVKRWLNPQHDGDGRVIGGDEYLSVLRGETGAILTSVAWPARLDGNDYNLNSRNLMGVAYLDGGSTPHLLVERGTYDHSRWSAFSFDGVNLSQKWSWSTYTSGNDKYKSSGSHSMPIADLDGDGRQEFCWGSVCFDGDGGSARVKWAVWYPGQENSLTIGHPDTADIADVRPDLPGPEIYYTIESNRMHGPSTVGQWKGAVVVDQNGAGHWIYTHGTHGHSGWAADVSGGNAGAECFYHDSYTNTNVLMTATGSVLNSNWYSTWHLEWDGDATRELIDGNGDILDLYGAGQQNIGSYGAILAIADLYGDFREEVIVRQSGSIKVYTNTSVVNSRRPTKLQERSYRTSMSTHGMGYERVPIEGLNDWMTVGPPTPPPAAPTGLAANAASASSIQLAWQDQSTNETGFVVEKSTDQVRFAPAATAGAGTETYLATGLLPATTYYFRVHAYNAGGDSGHSNVASATTHGGGAVTSTTGFQNFPFAQQTGVFTVELDAMPNGNNIDALTALASGSASGTTDLACIVRFNPAGSIDARNGGSYTAAAPIPYTAGTSYHFRLVVDIPNRRYDAFVRPAGGDESTIGDNLAFRSEQSNATALARWSLVHFAGGDHTVSDFTAGPLGNVLFADGFETGDAGAWSSTVP